MWSHFRYRALPVLLRSFIGSRTGTGIYVWSHLRYRALPVPVWSFFGSRTRIGIHVRGPISGAFLILDEVRGISLSLSFRDKHAPEPENKKNERSTQYRKCDFSPVLVPLLEMGRPFSVLVNCVFGYLHRYILQQ